MPRAGPSRRGVAHALQEQRAAARAHIGAVAVEERAVGGLRARTEQASIAKLHPQGRECAIRQALLDLAANGAAVLCISQDLDELMEISDRFGALNEGRLSEIRPAQELNVDEIGLMMGGAHGMEVAHV